MGVIIVFDHDFSKESFFAYWEEKFLKKSLEI